MLLGVAQCSCLCFCKSVPLTAFQSRGCRSKSCSTAPHTQNMTPHFQPWLRLTTASVPYRCPAKLSILHLPRPSRSIAVSSAAGTNCNAQQNARLAGRHPGPVVKSSLLSLLVNEEERKTEERRKNNSQTAGGQERSTTPPTNTHYPPSHPSAPHAGQPVMAVPGAGVMGRGCPSALT